MTDLSELIERVRNATGPDRELDGEITTALGDGPGDGWELITHSPGMFMMDAGRWIKGGRIRTPKPFTASLDAITALIEKKLPGWDWGASSLGDDGTFGEIWEHGWHDDTVVNTTHRTAPLALCLAFLLALQSQDKDHDQ